MILPQWLYPVLATFLCCLPGPTAAAQDEAAAGETPVQLPPLTMAEALAIEPEVLRLRLTPLRLEVVEAEAERWLDVLEQKAQKLAEVEIAIRAAEADSAARQDLLDTAADLREERAALIELVGVALDDLEAKGGDIAEELKYVTAVSDLNIDVSDAGAAWETVKAWLVSEEGGVKWGLRLLAFVLTIVAAFIVAAVVGALIRQGLKRFQRGSKLLRDFLVTITHHTIVIIGVVLAIGQLGVDIGPLLAAIAGAGLVIGLALQGTLSNFASGVMILLYRPFDVGDVVEVAEVSGKVESMTLVTTTISTFDNQVYIVPNNEIWNNVISNETARSMRRVDLSFGIGYGDDISKAKQVLQELAAAHELVLDDPPTVVKVGSLGESTVNLLFRPWSKTDDYWTVYWELTEQVKERFEAEGISMPFPQRDVHMYHHHEQEGDAAARQAAAGAAAKQT